MTLTDTTILELLEFAVTAPSGDNCQPWRFEVRGDLIRLFNQPDRDVSLFNYRQRASFIAHGALIENMVIAASTKGLRTEIALFPNGSEPDLVAEFRLVPANLRADPLAGAIGARCTNRRRYRGGMLQEHQCGQLISAASAFSSARVRLFSGSDQMRLAQIIGMNDRLVFENRDLHAFLFDHIRWRVADAEAKRDGMDVRTLELTPPDALAFRLFKSYELVSVLNCFGVSRIIGANARRLAMSAAALGVISLQTMEPEDFITCGRAMERVWLEATRQGLAFQLMTGITCLMGRVADDDPGTLTATQVAQVRDGRCRLMELLDIEKEIPMIIFRVGEADPPTARSVRLPVRVCTQRS